MRCRCEGLPIKLRGSICRALPAHQSYKGTVTDDDERSISRVKRFHFATFPHNGCPGAIKVWGEICEYIKLEQCDIVNRHFISTLLAGV